MKKTKSTGKFIKDIYTSKLRVTTSSDLDKRVLANSMNVLEKVKSKDSAKTQRDIWAIAARSRITQVAAVLIVLSAICLLTLSDKGEPKQYETAGTEVAVISETPAELVSAISLSMAFRDGDLKAVERQFDKAEKKVKPSLTEQITIDQLICELEGC